jgi:hypothetical protein
LLTRVTTTLLLLILAPCIWAKGVYLTAEQFLQQNFPDSAPTAKTIWLNDEMKQEIAKFLYRDYRQLRVRYWQQGPRSAWIFDEIGKERPITIGVVLNEQKIESVKILAFRESRGWEVKYDFFTDQFQDASLTAENGLSQHIDGITGATLSVRAVERAAKLALFLSQKAKEK